MALTEIIYCPDDDIDVTTNASTSFPLRYGCDSHLTGDPLRVPQVIDLATYCTIEDCSAEVGEPVTGTEINQEVFEAAWPWALLMLATAFGLRLIRKAIYAKA